MIYQRGQSLWLYTHGDLKKVAACQVKPSQLIDHTSMDNISETMDDRRQVMMEDRLQDVDDVQSRDDHQDDEKGSVGAKYLKVVNSASFSDLAIYTV